MLYVAIVVITCLINIILGSFVLSRNPKQSASRMFFCICLFVSLWTASNYITGEKSVGLFYNNLFNRGAFLFSFLAVASCMWFSYVFPVTKRLKAKVRLFLLLIVLLVGFISVTSLVDGSVSASRTGLSFSLGPYLFIYLVTMFVFLVIIIRNLKDVINKGHGREKQQAIYMLVGFGVPIVFGLLTNVILPYIAADWQLANFGPSFTIFFVCMISYSIVRHHLFDIRIAVARSVAYVSSIGAVVLLYSVMAFGLLNLVFSARIGNSNELALAIFTAAAALVFNPIKRYFDRVTNRLFYRDAYDSQGVIGQLNNVLVANIHINSLLRKSAVVIAQNLKSEYCIFGIKETKLNGARIIGTINKTFTDEDISLVRRLTPHVSDIVNVTDDLPLQLSNLKSVLIANGISVLVRLVPNSAGGGEGLGYILLGAKRSGNPYNRQDTQVLDIISRELVIAIQNALQFEEIQQFNETLQQNIEEATHKLRLTNDRLRSLDQTKDDFISMASHQLRTPLTSVKGYVSMVLDGDAGEITPMQRKLLNQSFISSQRMVYLIADLLNISRLRTGKFVIVSTPTNLAKVVQSEVEQLIETAKSRGLELIYHRPEHFPVYMLDETKIRQVVMNFIDNAIYYTPTGGHITVELKEKPQSIEYTVTDNGIGVPKVDQHHLFTKFYRAPNARRARPDGTGLGLFMAKKVIIAQDGAIIFRSMEGKGSTFGFSFSKSKLTLAPSTPPK